MKGKWKLLTAMIVVFILNGCKKDNNQPANMYSNQTTTIDQTLTGKWFIVKDSIQAFDYNTPMSFTQKLAFSNADYVVFNKDSTGTISSQVAYTALYTDYTRLYINPNEPEIPNLNFKYKFSAKDSTLSIPLINSLNGIGYGITKLDAKNLVLYTEDVITKYPHSYTFKQHII